MYDKIPPEYYVQARMLIEKDYPVPTKDVDKLAKMLYDNANKTLIEKEK